MNFLERVRRFIQAVEENQRAVIYASYRPREGIYPLQARAPGDGDPLMSWVGQFLIFATRKNK